jgi:hypothetical protein
MNFGLRQTNKYQRAGISILLWLSAVGIVEGSLRNWGPDDHVFSAMQQFMFDRVDLAMGINNDDVKKRVQEMKADAQLAVLSRNCKNQE